MIRSVFLYFVGLSVALLVDSTLLFAADKTLEVIGWSAIHNLYASDRPDEALGNDPVVGRQACPSLVRYNAVGMKPEAVLLKTLPDVNQTRDRWTFALRPNLRWWGGSAVSNAELASYLERELKDVLSDRHIDLPFKVSAQNTGVEVQWSQAPGFNAMILGGRPLWRATSGKPTGFECAGLYTITGIDNSSLTMQLSKGYSGKFQTIKLSQAASGASSSISFVSDALISPSTTMVPSRKCEAFLDIPFVTAIIWNQESRWAGAAGARQALTQAIPRGEILRTAAADLGSLVSGPLLRNHPGYASQQVVPPSNLEVASNLLNAAGFKQATIGAPRFAADGAVMHLRILRANKTRQPLLEKIISDSYASLGIELEFSDNNGAENINQADGALAAVALPWPELDLRDFLHSRPQKKLSAFPFFVSNDKSLDEALDAYALSLIEGKPRIDLLTRVHARFADLESWSMIMGHQACVKTVGLGLKGKLNVADPDWFRRLIVD